MIANLTVLLYYLARSTSSGKLEYEKAKKRLQAIEKRQDILLRGNNGPFVTL